VSLPTNSFLTKAAFVLILSCLTISPAFSACHCVTASGSGSKTGADWNNAYAGLPATLVRGDIYYLADGTYPSYTFNTAVSGTKTVEIRKAQSYDNCTSTGWNTSTMGAAQAVFPFTSTQHMMDIQSSYFILNGNGTSTAPGCGGAPGSTVTSEPPTPSDCGIRVDNSTCTSNNADACDGPIDIEPGYGHVTIEYVELVGNAMETSTNTSDNAEIQTWGATAGNTNQTFEHIYGRDSACVYIQYAVNNHTAAYNYWWGTEVNGAPGSSPCHGQYSYMYGASGGTENHSVFRDITGTSVFTFGMAASNSNWTFYDNVFWNSSGFNPNFENPPSYGFITNGIFSCIGGAACTNIQFYQNTIVNKGGQAGVELCDTSGGCTATVENNIWYLSTADSSTPSPPSFFGEGTFTQDHNSFLQSGSSCPSGTANVCDNSSSNPFTNWQNGVFTLASDGPDWDNRLSLSSPYTTDVAGNTLTTDRGAYQYVSGPPQPPADVKATPH